LEKAGRSTGNGKRGVERQKKNLADRPQFCAGSRKKKNPTTKNTRKFFQRQKKKTKKSTEWGPKKVAIDNVKCERWSEGGGRGGKKRHFAPQKSKKRGEVIPPGPKNRKKAPFKAKRTRKQKKANRIAPGPWGGQQKGAKKFQKR